MTETNGKKKNAKIHLGRFGDKSLEDHLHDVWIMVAEIHDYIKFGPYIESPTGELIDNLIQSEDELRLYAYDAAYYLRAICAHHRPPRPQPSPLNEKSSDEIPPW